MKRNSPLLTRLCTVATICLLTALAGCPNDCGENNQPRCFVPVSGPGVYEVKYTDAKGVQQDSFLMSDGSPLIIQGCKQIDSQNSADPSLVCNLVCPHDIVAIRHALGGGLIPVNFPSPSAANCPAVTITCDPPSGSNFGANSGNDGQVVVCSATDTGGNRIEAVCGFRVSVYDECLQDDNDPNVFVAFQLFHLPDGSETAGFTMHCADGQVFRSIGGVTMSGSSLHISDDQTKIPDGEGGNGTVFTADFDPVAKTASAILTRPDGTTCTLKDSNTDHGSCQSAQ